MRQQEAMTYLRSLPGWNELQRTLDLTASDGKRYRIHQRSLGAIEQLDECGIPIEGAAQYCWHSTMSRFSGWESQQIILYKWMSLDAEKVKQKAAQVVWYSDNDCSITKSGRQYP